MPLSYVLPSSLTPGTWKLTFDDEFNDPSAPLNVADGGPFTNAFMSYGDYRTLPGNGEQELYVDPSFIPNPAGTASNNADAPQGSGGTPLGIDPFSYSNGNLDIAASLTPPSAKAAGITLPWVSGMISTEQTFTQQYGYFEMRAELPAGQGIWPQFWLFGTNTGYPEEIDVMEALGNDTSRVYQSYHSPQSVSVNPVAVGDDSGGFHTYGVEWSPTELTYFVDGVQTVQLANPFTDQSPVYMIVNLAVGGTWGGNADATTPSPSTMQIDYVRAYQNSDWSSNPTPCFCIGTCIATPSGERPVEHLRVGEQILTSTGAYRTIKWIGEGHIGIARGERSAATPVIVKRGALGPNVPYADLHVTKGHSLFLGGVLIPAEFLVNHRSIIWDDHAQDVRFRHIELETHEILLANGAPAESYRDDGNRWLFSNHNTRSSNQPMAAFAPVLTGGAVVDTIWQELLDRAGPRPGLCLTEDPDIHLMVDGKRLNPISRGPGTYFFRFEAGLEVARLRSRGSSPAELGTARDPRVLGVALHRLVVSAGRILRTVEAHDNRLLDGFHGYEHGGNLQGGIRWTDGDARLPREMFEGLTGRIQLEVHLCGTTRYVDDAAEVRDDILVTA